MKIAIQGVNASFHAIAARRLYGENIELVYCKTFNEVFASLQAKDADKAVVAIENSLYGSINEVYDLLLRYNFWICGEIYEQISLHLLAYSTNIEDITDVYSQAPALAESSQFLDEELPNADRHEYPDTALAAEAVAMWKKPQIAAIASEDAAKQYKLQILKRNIETHHQNYTRFIALSRTISDNNEAGKTTLTFRTPDTPGSLHKALGVFAQFGLNLSKFESRPIVGSAWKYIYYVDIEANIDKKVLSELKNYATEIRVLGNYSRGAFETT